MRWKEIMEDVNMGPNEKAALYQKAKANGFLIDPKDTSLSGGVDVNAAKILASIDDPNSKHLIITDDMTPNDVFKWMWGQVDGA